MLGLAKHSNDENAILMFLMDLERLAARMPIRREDISARIERIDFVVGVMRCIPRRWILIAALTDQ
jgi:hypothetical protein